MKRWVYGILLIGAVLAIGLVLYNKQPESPRAIFSLVSKPIVVDQEILLNYKNRIKAEEERIAREIAEKAAIEAAKKSPVTSKNLSTPTSAGAKIVTYTISAKGNPRSGIDEFRTLTAATFNDQRGWIKAGVYFKEVTSGGNFNLILSEAQYLPSYSSICSTKYSCRIGRNVIINDDRWSGASDSWNAAGGSLRDYRHMVVNHETGHFLGHKDNVPVCSDPGAKAPLMQQQSINLRGCIFNPWPLDEEVWTNR